MKGLSCAAAKAACIAISFGFAGRTVSAEMPDDLVKRRVLAIERAWSVAEIAHDIPALRRIMDNRFVATFGTAPPIGREDFIKIIVSQTMLSQEPSDVTIIVDRDVAVVVDSFTVRGTNNGQPYTNVVRVTATYVKRHGRWRVLAEHAVLRVP